jgi:hypothetical protein
MPIPTIDELRALLPTTDGGKVHVYEYDDRTMIDFRWRNRPHQTDMMIGHVTGITLTIMKNEPDRDAVLAQMLEQAKRRMAEAYAVTAPSAP